MNIFMILKKLVISLSLLWILNGCAQNAVFLGPVITGASTGSIYQAGLSYGSGEIVKKVTGKTTTENIKSILKSEKVQAVENENYEEFVNTAKNLIYVNSEIKDLANQ